MSRTFTICWTRLSENNRYQNWLERYSQNDCPRPLPLEGRGIQYLFALENNELDVVLNKMKSDQHEIEKTSYQYQIDDHPPDYCVELQYGREPSYFLTKRK